MDNRNNQNGKAQSTHRFNTAMQKRRRDRGEKYHCSEYDKPTAFCMKLMKKCPGYTSPLCPKRSAGKK